MATKTKAKTAAKKTVAHKPVATHKPAPAKANIPKKKIEPLKNTPPVAPAHHVAQEKAHPKKSASKRPAVKSVTLIDKKHPQKKAADGEIKKKTTVLPPISRIREIGGRTVVFFLISPSAAFFCGCFLSINVTLLTAGRLLALFLG